MKQHKVYDTNPLRNNVQHIVQAKDGVKFWKNKLKELS